MNIVLTRTAESGRLVRGITLNEIEETIKEGIKTIERKGILASRKNIQILYNKKNDLFTIKMVMNK
ncbi:hypothetical protein CL621_04675 [archaeon]|nr:hypothetical protein [archaeon]|tara:strand:+ start:746 stop:943 length:198 start_codon:yes stop_codon:yes gene_type:complete